MASDRRIERAIQIEKKYIKLDFKNTRVEDLPHTASSCLRR